MIIRSEQMEVFQSAAEENFVQRLKTHLLENYAKSVVRLPDKEAAVDELPEETLDLLVRHSIERARSYDLSYESSISAFSAVRFDVAPNFDGHSMSKLCLKDESVEPNTRLNELLKILTDEHWGKIKSDYDVNDWQSKAEDSVEMQDSETIEKPENPKASDFTETVMNVGNPEKTDKPAEVKNPNFDEKVMNIDTPKKPEKLASDVDFNFLDTVLNIDVKKE